MAAPDVFAALRIVLRAWVARFVAFTGALPRGACALIATLSAVTASLTRGMVLRARDAAVLATSCAELSIPRRAWRSIALPRLIFASSRRPTRRISFDSTLAPSATSVRKTGPASFPAHWRVTDAAPSVASHTRLDADSTFSPARGIVNRFVFVISLSSSVKIARYAPFNGYKIRQCARGFTLIAVGSDRPFRGGSGGAQGSGVRGATG
ncbi:MAG: hypothetical protein ACM338_03565 [Betaproteobacteria bacterium]